MILNNYDMLNTCVLESDLILVGLGEEWVLDGEQILRDLEQKNASFYQLMKTIYENEKYQPVIAIFERYYYKHNIPVSLGKAYQNLFQLLNEKNYFIVSLTIDSYLEQMGFRADRCVNPCGNQKWMQCEQGCCEELLSSEELLFDMNANIEKFLMKENDQPSQNEIERFLNTCLELYLNMKCEHCHGQMTLNTLNALKYREEGYLDNWQIYMKWLQGTVNKKLCVIEAGAGMQLPSVIRWPFEKTVFYNQKATLFRIHEKFYQLTEEVAERAYSCNQNAVQLFEEEKVEAAL